LLFPLVCSSFSNCLI